ncbi:serine hydrolase domain-containing protein [Thermoactinospora rubra]|uniref:serine hydrolase domain-containing protein n=1 Tax=Thermoactinospora rubra TaxID=1088767 RepID=UPI000A10BC5A|nr:serine hydrolase domain-containing protein [Thermoactinospora rubra]
MTIALADLSKRFQVPGASLAYWHDGRLHQEVTGVLNLGTGVETTPDTLFQIGSITKVWTTVQIMLLAEQGRLDLDAPVAQILPSIGRGVTIRHLLTHTSGIDGDFFHDTGRGDDCLARYVEDAGDLAATHPPGAAHSYCNAGFVVAGRIVEVVTGRAWDAALREQVVEPLGLTHTWTLAEDVIRFRAALGHLGEPGRTPEPSPRWGLMRSVGPAGLICSTAADVVRFGRSFLEGTLLRRSSVEEMARPHVELPERTLGTHWGLGWILDTWDGRAVWTHGGNTVGQAAMLWVLPDTGTTVAVLANGGNTRAFFQELAEELFPRLAGVRPPAAPRPPAEPFPAGGRHDGVYERTGVRITLSGTRMTVENTGPLTDLASPMAFDLVFEDEGHALARREGDPVWHRVVFFTLGNGTPYVYFGLRATPRRS